MPPLSLIALTVLFRIHDAQVEPHGRFDCSIKSKEAIADITILIFVDVCEKEHVGVPLTKC